MSNLNVNKISAVGGGSTITIAGIASVTNNISVGNSVTATTFYGDGSQLSGISVDTTKIETGNTKVETIDTGSDGHIKFTTEGTERLRIESNGVLRKGHTTNAGQVETQLSPSNQFYGDDRKSGIRIADFSDSAFSSTIQFVKSRNATIGQNTALQDNDFMGSIYWGGANGTNFQPAAFISARIDGTVSGSAMPAELTFATNSGNDLSERMRIDSAGFVQGNINAPCWFGSQDTQHNITTATWTSLLNLGNSVINPSINNSGWNESTGTFTAQAGQAGYYYCFGSAGIDDVQDADVVYCGISKNGANPVFYVEQRALDQSANIILGGAMVAQVIQLAVGDTAQLRVYHNEGSTEPTEPNRCFFGGYRLAIL